LDEVEGAGDRAVSAAADEGDALEAAWFPCHFSVPLRRLGCAAATSRFWLCSLAPFRRFGFAFSSPFFCAGKKKLSSQFLQQKLKLS
jgi:hypothetical protein